MEKEKKSVGQDTEMKKFVATVFKILFWDSPDDSYSDSYDDDEDLSPDY